jgi:transcriptional regulator with XRE-family HTH domain
MSITDFAAKIGKTKQSVSLYVKNGIPGSELIEQIADVLGVNPCELLESIIR